MIILVDIGNTNIFIGVYQNQKLISTYRTITDKRKSSDDYAINIRVFVEHLHVQEPVEGAIISSVVPLLTETIQKALYTLYEVKALIVGPKLKSGIPIRMDNPNEVGADLISVSVGAIKKYGYPLLIVDLGTATKIIAIDQQGAFVGGIIMPGIKISMDALVSKTSQLPEVSLIAPKHVIGKNTFDCMNSGAVYGHVEAIKGVARLMEKELGYPCHYVLTGGYGKILYEHIGLDVTYDENLILDGLLHLYFKNGGGLHA